MQTTTPKAALKSEQIKQQIFAIAQQENQYVVQPILDNWVKEAIAHYDCCSGHIGLFKSYMNAVIRQSIRRSIAESLSTPFFDMVVALREEQGLFLYPDTIEWINRIVMNPKLNQAKKLLSDYEDEGLIAVDCIDDADMNTLATLFQESLAINRESTIRYARKTGLMRLV